MVWVWGKPLSVTDDFLACPRCGAAIPAGDSQQLHHQWHEKLSAAEEHNAARG